MNGNIDLDNMSWFAALHMGRYSSLKSTCQMSYHPAYVDFYSLVYMLFSASAINVLRDPVHFGHVVSGKSHRSQYDPKFLQV